MRHIGFQRGVLVASGPSSNSHRDDIVRASAVQGQRMQSAGKFDSSG
jgi:hypothetical protein